MGCDKNPSTLSRELPESFRTQQDDENNMLINEARPARPTKQKVCDLRNSTKREETQSSRVLINDAPRLDKRQILIEATRHARPMRDPDDLIEIIEATRQTSFTLIPGIP